MKISKLNSDKAVLKEVGSRISQLRLNKNFSQQKLAEEAGVSHSTINRIENGSSIQFSTLIRVMRTLDLLDNMDVLIPEPTASPIQQLNLKGRSRKRASKETKVIAPTKPWAWQDDAESADSTLDATNPSRKK